MSAFLVRAAVLAAYGGTICLVIAAAEFVVETWEKLRRPGGRIRIRRRKVSGGR